MNLILDFFIKKSLKDDWELYRKAKLFVAILLLSFFFSIIGLFDTTSQLDIITYELLFLSASALISLFVLKFNGIHNFLGQFYAFTSWSAFSMIIFYSGGINSPAFEWLLISIIPSYIFCGRKGGNLWWFINLITAFLFAFLQKFMVTGPITMFNDLLFLRDTSFSIGLLIFIPLVVQFFIKTNEDIKGSLKSLNFDLIESQKLIKSSEEKFKAIVESFPNGSIVILDKSYRVITVFNEYINGQKEEYLQSLNKPIFDLIPKEEFESRNHIMMKD